jgi:CheY-like chemotaxis protein
VIVVNTFTKALELLDVRKIDLIISDVHLENGGTVFDFMRHVKRDKETTKIPFVLYSHQPTRMAKYLADGLRTTSRMLGAALYIEMESFDATEFRKHIESVLTKDTHEYR